MPGNQVRVGVGVTGAKGAASDLDRLRDKFDKLQKQGAKGIGMGVGAGIAIAGIHALTSAVSESVGFLEDATKAAMEDEASVSRLGASLRANVANWDGNTAAIEKTIKARMALGFSDDEQRNSLAKLVVATHDVNTALDVQRTAMDLARLKGISLADAGDALTKVEAGQFRALKSLGIVLKQGATAQDALLAVQKAAKGQAADYANTIEGKLVVAQVHFNENMEDLGRNILPLVNSGLDLLTGSSGQLASINDNIANLISSGTVDQLQTAHDALTSALNDLSALPGQNDFLGKLVAGDQVDALRANLAAVDSAMSSLQDESRHNARTVADDFSKMETASTDWRDTYRDVSGDIIRSSHKVRTQLAKDAQGLIDDYFDPIEKRAELHDTRLQTIADFERLRNAKTKEDHRQASDSIVQDLDDQATALADLGDKGKLTAKDVKRFAADTTAYYKALGIKVPADIQKIIDRLETLAGMPNIHVGVTASGTYHAPGRGPLKGSGGPVMAGQTYTVGDRGPEQLVMGNQSGTIIPNGGSAGTVNYHVTVNAGIGSGLSAGDARKLADTIGPALYADMQRKGYLPRGNGLTG